MAQDDAAAAAANDVLVTEFLAAWERRDTEHIVGCFADDGVYHSMPLTPIVGKAAIREWVAGFEGKRPGRLEVRHQVATATVVLNERTDHITLNGQAVVLPICGVFEIAGERITAWREYYDLGPARAAYAAE
jgi:limonene-1,2-epoxide hydrolase